MSLGFVPVPAQEHTTSHSDVAVALEFDWRNRSIPLVLHAGSLNVNPSGDLKSRQNATRSVISFLSGQIRRIEPLI